MIKNAAETKAANIAAMGEPLGAMYSALWQEVAILHAHWDQYVQLFGTNSERIALLNDVAPFFFHMTQDGLWEATLLHLSRLTDAPFMIVRKERKENLSVRALPELIDDPKLKATVEKLVDDAVRATNFARDWRHRRIAHRDLKLALEEPTTPLADGSRADVKTALGKLSDVLNAVERHYHGAQTAFGFGAPMTGATSLLHVLELGMQKREAELKELEEVIKADDEVVAKKTQRRTMALGAITMLSYFGVWILTPVIWLFTIYLAYLTSFRALLAALFLPLLAQLYWIWMLSTETGSVLNTFTLLCLAWIVLAVTGTIARAKVEMS